MIHYQHRFHGRSSLRFVYQKGVVVRSGPLSLRAVHNNRTPSYRVAVVVSRKVSKSAVVRNRIRRRVYEIVRTHAGQIKPQWDLVLSAYDEQITELAHANLQQLVLDLLHKAGALEGQVGGGAATVKPAKGHNPSNHAIVEQNKETL